MESQKKIRKCTDLYRGGLFQGLMIAVLVIATIVLWINVWFSSTELNRVKELPDSLTKDLLVNEATGVLVMNILVALFVTAVFISTTIIIAFSHQKKVKINGKLICDETGSESEAEAPEAEAPEAEAPEAETESEAETD